MIICDTRDKIKTPLTGVIINDYHYFIIIKCMSTFCVHAPVKIPYSVLYWYSGVHVHVSGVCGCVLYGVISLPAIPTFPTLPKQL